MSLTSVEQVVLWNIDHLNGYYLLNQNGSDDLEEILKIGSVDIHSQKKRVGTAIRPLPHPGNLLPEPLAHVLGRVNTEWKISRRNDFVNCGDVVIHCGVSRSDDVAIRQSSSLLEVIIQPCSCKPSELIG